MATPAATFPPRHPHTRVRARMPRVLVKQARTLTTIASIVTLCAMPCFAQQQPSPQPAPPATNAAPNIPANLPPGTRKVADQGQADRTPLHTTLRPVQADLRQGGAGEENFSILYTFRDTDGRTKYARVSGAITAIFPQSEYADLPGPGSQAALIPAGTTFHLGKIKRFDTIAPVPQSARYTPPSLTYSASTSTTLRTPQRAETGVQTRADIAPPLSPSPTSADAGASRGQPNAPAPIPAASEPPTRGMLSDETYRRTRVRELLTAAVNVDLNTTR